MKCSMAVSAVGGKRREKEDYHACKSGVCAAKIDDGLEEGEQRLAHAFSEKRFVWAAAGARHGLREMRKWGARRRRDEQTVTEGYCEKEAETRGQRREAWQFETERRGGLATASAFIGPRLRRPLPQLSFLSCSCRSASRQEAVASSRPISTSVARLRQAQVDR